MPEDAEPIDWKKVQDLTVKQIVVAHYAGDALSPSDWLMPLVSLWSAVDTGDRKVDVEIECPIIDETKL
jgi:hypothetical protein